MTPLLKYLTELNQIRATGSAVKETSYYAPLANLLNALGSSLNPGVSCVINLQNSGAGIPDGGFFTKDQLRTYDDQQPSLADLLPARGVMEVKSVADEVTKIAASSQVRKYLDHYGLVLVTNYRDFLLVGQHPATGQPHLLERFTLAADVKTFWQLAGNTTGAEPLSEGFTQFMLRVLSHKAPLRNPKDVAWFLASYARDARSRIEAVDLPELQSVRQALEQALGIRFEGAKGEAFFRSTFIQTLFYGMFSAWVLHHDQKPAATMTFDWRLTGWTLRLRLIRELFNRVAQPGSLGKLNLIEILDWAAQALNRVETDAFFTLFATDEAVQYFYEPFLEAFDPDLRKELGVWYTPPELVQYMVQRVDEVLRTELNVPNGLADPNVIILDPCCGTGAFLVETAKLIHRRLVANGDDGFVGDDIRDALMNRVFGFEIMPAPFVVAHLQLGLLLQRWQAPLNDSLDQRVGVYLTNALTGWEPATKPAQQLLDFPELQHERDAAAAIKQQQPILVMLGNPPYNAFAGVSAVEESNLVAAYKQGLQSQWGIRKFNLDDLYIRFFRLAQRRVAEKTGRGVVCFVSNFSYLREPSFVVMRQQLLHQFSRVWIDNLNGDSRETGKKTPDGQPDPSAFSTDQNKEGIQKGTAIGLLVRHQEHQPAEAVQFRHFWGKTKRADLLRSLTNAAAHPYQTARPVATTRFSFYLTNVHETYLSWPKLTDLCEINPLNGMMEKRRGALFGIDRDTLRDRMQTYHDKTLTWETIQALKTGLSIEAAGFKAKTVRSKVLQTKGYDETLLQPYAVRPFDNQYCYYSPVSPLWNRARPDLLEQVKDDNELLIIRMQKAKDLDGGPIMLTKSLFDDGLLNLHAVAIPCWHTEKSVTGGLFVQAPVRRANLSVRARTYLTALGLPNPDQDPNVARLLWHHALAIGYAPAYQHDNADGIGQDYPRIPLPNSADVLRASAQLGAQIARLLLPDSDWQPAPEVPESHIARITFQNPAQKELHVAANWGYRTTDGKVMPGSGRAIRRAYTPTECEALGSDALALLGPETYDVHLNDTTWFGNVPAAVWQYYIGGYQVLKKWLSYREVAVLGRPLNLEEVREWSNTARRLTALLLLTPSLNANYAQCATAAEPGPDEEAI